MNQYRLTNKKRINSEQMLQNNHGQANYIAGFLSSIPIENMDLSRRAKNSLLRAGLETALDIQRYIETDDLLGINNVGLLVVNEIEQCMNALLEKKGLDLSVDEINLFTNNELESTIIPTILYDDLPIEILTEELGSELIDRLKSAHFERLGELLNLSQTVMNFTQNVSTSLIRLINHQKEMLQDAITIGKLHPQAQYRDMSIKAWLDLAPENHDEQLEFLSLLTQVNETKSLNQELSVLFTRISGRDLEIFMKYFNESLTLEQVGKEQEISKERVRQITSNVASILWWQINQKKGLYLQSALLVAESMGEQLSLKSWRQSLKSRQIIESYPIQENFDLFDILCALLRSIDKSKYPPNLEINGSLTFILNSPSDLSYGLIKAIEEVPSKAKRKVQRKISYVGGIHHEEASRILDASPQQTAHILEYLGFKEIIQDWYTIASGEFKTRWPILKAGLAMIECCGPLEFNLFCDGIRRYISRFYDVIAPPIVMKAHLEVLGFELKDEYVYWHEVPSGYLAKSDQCFMHVIEKYGIVVTFQEVVEVFQEKGFSIASATSRVLPQSPIVEKVDLGLYKIRGQDHTWEDIENAKNRQELVDYDPEVTYGIDGIIRYRITIGTWALNGVVSINSSQQPLPDLGDGWEVLVENESYGTARRDEYLIWGLSSAFNVLGIQIGDRVELAFNAWEKPIIGIRKI